MKHIRNYLLLLFICSPLFMGCSNDDGYSLGKFWVEVASVVPMENGGYYIKLDDGKKLWPAASVARPPSEYTRAQVNYTILSDSISGFDHYVKVNYIEYILTKNIKKYDPENDESLGNDKIKILEFWQGDDFLNIHFGINISGHGIAHAINMVDYGMDEAGFIKLELRHNANGDVADRGAKGLVAFDLRPYKDEEKDEIKFKIKLNAFNDSESEYVFVYKKETNTKSPSAQSIINDEEEMLVFE